MTNTDKILEYTMYDLRGEWASETNKKEILSQLNKKLKIKIAQALAEERVSVVEKGAGEVEWNKKETMQIIIKDNGTAWATTWEGYYATDVKLPTIAAAAEGVFFNEEQTKAVNALVSTSIQQAIAEERERVRGVMKAYPNKLFELNNGKMPWVIFQGKADEEEKFTLYKLGFEDAMKILASLDTTK